jgi:hypothetical protein
MRTLMACKCNIEICGEAKTDAEVEVANHGWLT